MRGVKAVLPPALTAATSHSALQLRVQQQLHSSACQLRSSVPGACLWQRRRTVESLAADCRDHTQVGAVQADKPSRCRGRCSVLEQADHGLPGHRLLLQNPLGLRASPGRVQELWMGRRRVGGALDSRLCRAGRPHPQQVILHLRWHTPLSDCLQQAGHARLPAAGHWRCLHLAMRHHWKAAAEPCCRRSPIGARRAAWPNGVGSNCSAPEWGRSAC